MKMSFKLKKQNMSSKASLCFILMYVYPQSNESSDHELYLQN